MNSLNNIWFVYPGQPYIGESIINLLLAFNNEPREDGNCSILEREHSQLSIALSMIALESIVKVKLDQIDEYEPSKIGELFTLTVDKNTSDTLAIDLWTELKILRNQIIHSAYFTTSSTGGHISKATRRKLESPYYRKFLDIDNERTINWSLKINPLSVTRYEALVCFLFFYWYGRKTGVWKINLPLHPVYVDSRIKYNIKNNWIDNGTYNHLIGSSNNSDFIKLIAFLSSRLPKKIQQNLYNLSKKYLNIDLKAEIDFTNTVLKMYKNIEP